MLFLLVSVNCKAQRVTYEELFEYFQMSIKDVDDLLLKSDFKRQPIKQTDVLVNYSYLKDSRKNPISIGKTLYAPSPLENINYESVYKTTNDDCYKEFMESMEAFGYKFVRTMNSDESTLTHYG